MRSPLPWPFAASLPIACVLAVSAASAEDTVKPVSDSTYIAMAHCAGLAGGTGADATSLISRLSDQARARSDDVMARANEARSDARRMGRDAGPEGRAALAHQWESQCKAFVT